MEIARRIAIKKLHVKDEDNLEFVGIRRGLSYWYNHENDESCAIDPEGEVYETQW